MDIVVMILERLVPLATLVIGVLILRWAKAKGLSDDLMTYLDRGYGELKKAVLYTNQTWVDALKKDHGNLTDEEKALAREKTIDAFNALLAEEVSIAINAVYGSVENWLDINLESAVGEVHK
jgi:hypothetical protein